jgi:hypothetical protein
LAFSAISAVAGATGGAIGAHAPAVRQAVGAIDGSAPPVDALKKRVDAAEQARFQLMNANDASALAGRLSSVADEVNALKGRVGDGDFTALSNQVAKLQSETDIIKAQSDAAAEAARAAFAVSAAYEAARASGSFEQAYTTLETILPADPNVQALAPLARSGAPSREELKQNFDLMQDDIIKAARISAAGAGFWGRVQAFLAQFVTVRRSGEGETPVGIVERASGRLAADDVPGAVAELSRLTGPAAQVIAPWLHKARARIEIDIRLAAIRQELSRVRS